jgi:diguanylate cyclase (GGDEF)-like protein
MAGQRHLPARLTEPTRPGYHAGRDAADGVPRPVPGPRSLHVPTLPGLRTLAVFLGFGAGFVLGAACVRPLAASAAPSPVPWWLGDADPLTGVATPRVFEDRLRNAVERRLRAPAPLAVMLVDLDHFALVNAEHGHDAGDAVLRAVAERLRNCVRTEDTVARLSADVFAVLVDDPGAAPVAVLGERVRLAVGLPVPLGRSRFVQVGASVAVVVSDGAHEAEALLAEADQKINDIKVSGRGRVELVVVPFG